MAKLSELPNIGKKLEEQLIQAGVDTPQKLRQTGSKEAWLRIYENDPSACINRLYAMEAAVQGVKKTELDDAVKQNLKEFVREVKGQK